jgi:UDP-N-acetylmuramate: L-alanyl-gamma-D-glutamyl-meso-diaminopimelate ligase
MFYEAIPSFTGASKRLELFADRPGKRIYRDFAHAPSKVQATTQAVREQFPNDLFLACLELHTFSSLGYQFYPYLCQLSLPYRYCSCFYR